MMKTLTLLLTSSTLAIGGAAQAAITVYTTQASFFAAVGTTGTDTFDDLEVAATPSPLARTAGAYGYTAAVGPNSSDFFPGSDDGIDTFLSTNNRFDTITFSGFTGGVSALGGLFFGSDVFGFSTAATSITLAATDASGTTTTVVLAPTTSTFRGFVSTGALTSFTVTIGDEAGVWPSVNNLVLANAATNGAVPEPGTWAMMIAGFGLIGSAMRRRTTVRFANA